MAKLVVLALSSTWRCGSRWFTMQFCFNTWVIITTKRGTPECSSPLRGCRMPVLRDKPRCPRYSCMHIDSMHRRAHLSGWVTPAFGLNETSYISEDQFDREAWRFSLPQCQLVGAATNQSTTKLQISDEIYKSSLRKVDTKFQIWFNLVHGCENGGRLRRNM